MSDHQREHLTLANVNVTGVLGFQRKIMKAVGLAMMIFGGLLCLTVIGIFIGLPLIIMGLVVYFLVPKLFAGMHRAMMPPADPPPRS